MQTMLEDRAFLFILNGLQEHFCNSVREGTAFLMSSCLQKALV